jgi:transcriptional regulator with XRE-family HTH domain
VNDLVTDFGKMLRLKRKNAGYSQEDFATLAGIERGNYGKMERGLVNVKLETLYKLAIALDCEFDEIMPPKCSYKMEVN